MTGFVQRKKGAKIKKPTNICITALQMKMTQREKGTKKQTTRGRALLEARCQNYTIYISYAPKRNIAPFEIKQTVKFQKQNQKATVA